MTSRGFSLVELVMASLIASAAGALLVGGLVAANRSTEYRLYQIFSTQGLANQLALLDDRISDSTPMSGTLAFNHGSWTLAVEAADESPTPLARATITVTQKDTASHVVTYRFVQKP